jgi:hypothetical protein
VRPSQSVINLYTVNEAHKSCPGRPTLPSPCHLLHVHHFAVVQEQHLFHQ